VKNESLVVRKAVLGWLFVVIAGAAQAETLPKLELGLGVASQYLRDYRGSTESQVQMLPIPFLVYRGEIFQADRDEVRGRFIRGINWELNASAEAALNGGSPDNKKREGMPELNSAFEVGPSLNFNLSGKNFAEGWSLRLPFRAVFAVDLKSVEPIGFNANPKFTYRKPDLFWGWNGKLDLGLLWATRDYHDYYYSVDTHYVTDDRPFYLASDGYSGSYTKFSLKQRFGQWWVGWNLRYDYLGGTTFEDSPLMETEHYFSTALAFGCYFWRSK